MSRSKSVIMWAIVRLVLGTLQIFLATLGVIFLITLGLHRATIAVAVAACGVTILSRILFHDHRLQPGNSPSKGSP